MKGLWKVFWIIHTILEQLLRDLGMFEMMGKDEYRKVTPLAHSLSLFSSQMNILWDHQLNFKYQLQISKLDLKDLSKKVCRPPHPTPFLNVAHKLSK